VHRFTNGLPRYYMVGRWDVVSEEKALDRMAAQEFDPRRSALIHAPVEVVPAPPVEPVQAGCELVEYTWHRVRLRTQSSHNAVMVGLERYDASWSVFVDGKRVPMWKADWMLRACPIPAGTHEVEWRLVGDGGRGFWVGVSGWLLAALAAGRLAVSAWMARRRQA
jgi:hypothetical protein